MLCLNEPPSVVGGRFFVRRATSSLLDPLKKACVAGEHRNPPTHATTHQRGYEVSLVIENEFISSGVGQHGYGLSIVTILSSDHFSFRSGFIGRNNSRKLMGGARRGSGLRVASGERQLRCLIQSGGPRALQDLAEVDM